MKKIEKYVAEDGTPFDTFEECATHETLSERDKANRVPHITIDTDEYDKLLLLLVNNDEDAGTIEEWCKGKGIFYPGVHEFPTIFVIECRHRASAPIVPADLAYCRTSGELETLETYIGRKAFELSIHAGELFHVND